MGALLDRVILNQKVFGTDLVDFFKKNTEFMAQKYTKSDDMCSAVGKESITPGRFYFFQYSLKSKTSDVSNWMKWSPVFAIDWKQDNMSKIVYCINFNFIPIEIRCQIFDQFISEKMFEKNSVLDVDFMGIYSELLNYGFEYSIWEYNAIQIDQVHQINLELLPRFLNSTHPKNKYDPNNLMDIWRAKLPTRKKRHQEMLSSTLRDFLDVNSIISGKYDVLSGHIERLQKSMNGFK